MGHFKAFYRSSSMNKGSAVPTKWWNGPVRRLNSGILGRCAANKTISNMTGWFSPNEQCDVQNHGSLERYCSVEFTFVNLSGDLSVRNSLWSKKISFSSTKTFFYFLWPEFPVEKFMTKICLKSRAHWKSNPKMFTRIFTRQRTETGSSLNVRTGH